MVADCTLGSPLSAKQKTIWSLILKGSSVSSVAEKLKTTRQYVNQTRLTAEATLGFSMVQNGDHGFTIASYYNEGSAPAHPPGYSPSLLKIDANGSTVWNQQYSRDWAWISARPSWPDETFSVVRTGDGGYIMTGPTNSREASYLAKTDENGNIQWSIDCGTPNADFGNCLIQAASGGWVIAGRNSLTVQETHVWLVKIELR
jgi:hypothetical protein